MHVVLNVHARLYLERLMYSVLLLAALKVPKAKKKNLQTLNRHGDPRLDHAEAVAINDS
jgi:hypothetical protein